MIDWLTWSTLKIFHIEGPKKRNFDCIRWMIWHSSHFCLILWDSKVKNVPMSINVKNTNNFCNSEAKFAINAAEKLTKYINVQIISFPCQCFYECQQTKIGGLFWIFQLLFLLSRFNVSNGWERYAHAGFQLNEFGISLPGKISYLTRNLILML